MLMNPQYPPSCYADIMYRSHVSQYPGNINPSTPASSAANPPNHPAQHVFHNNNTSVPEYYGSGSLSGSCYTPTPPPSERGAGAGLLSLDPSHSDLGYGYGSLPSMDSNHHLYPSAVTSIWNGPQHHLFDEKRGPVIMGQAPTQPPPKRKGGRKPKDDPNLPPAEKQKRILRRLRNKEAAAKCRERRMNHTSGLLKQIEEMERRQKLYEDQINSLRLNKNKCEKVLETHRRACDKTFVIPSTTRTNATASNTSSPASNILLPSEANCALLAPATTCSSVDSRSHSGSSTPSSVTTTNTNLSPYPPITYSSGSLAAPPLPSSSRRKQTTPKLSLDTSCAASHRLSSSSSNGDLHSPLIMP